jgi:branched-subunit amino acid aminotransferase/4-amino-4-deoxychorismate lyase
MPEVVYLNGLLLPKDKAFISVDDYGFLSGAGLFETMRSYNGRIFLLEEHLDRLLRSAPRLGLAGKLDKEELTRACRDTLKANNLQDARLRLTVSMGEAGLFPGIISRPTMLVTVSRYIPLPEEKYEQGFKAAAASFRRFSGATLAGIKSISYLPNLLARREAKAAGYDEAFFLNEGGCISEGSISNIFFVTSQDKLVTPPLVCGPLPGVTRAVVFELTAGMGLEILEDEVGLEDLSHFKEAFLTNSVAEVMPLVEVWDGEKTIIISTGKPGEITLKLMVAYKEMVRRQTT